MSDLVERLEVAAQWDDSPSSLIHEAIAALTAAQKRIEELTRTLEDIISAADSFQDEEGYEVAGQVRIRARALLSKQGGEG